MITYTYIDCQKHYNIQYSDNDTNTTKAKQTNNNIYEEYIIPEPINEENNFDLHESLIEVNSTSHLIQELNFLSRIY